MEGTSRLKFAARLTVAVGIAAASIVPIAGIPSAQAAATWKIQVGANGDAPNQDLTLMLPSKLTVNVGDTVNFVLNQPGAPHTVTFVSGAPEPDLFIPVPGAPPGALQVNPIVAAPTRDTTYDGTGFRNSGIMGLVPNVPTTFTLTFTKAGSFDYFCELHDFQHGNITVVDAGAALPVANQAGVDAAAQQEIAAGKTELTTLARGQAAAYPQGASPSWKFGIDVNSQKGSVTSYFPATSQVRTGDTVQWTNNSPFEIHTVTFLAGGQLPDLILPNGQVNPAVGAPSGGNTQSGNPTNSGILEPGATYSLTFSKAGSYPYICAVHGELHTGVITVGDSAVPPANPSAPVAPPSGGNPPIGIPTPPSGIPSLPPGGIPTPPQVPSLPPTGTIPSPPQIPTLPPGSTLPPVPAPNSPAVQAALDALRGFLGSLGR